ncbi:hypothetical protein V1522DRAFT_421299 [Lipomyces starkeyi]
MTSLADTASDIEKNEKHSGAVASEPEFDDIDVQDGAVREKGLAAPNYFANFQRLAFSGVLLVGGQYGPVTGCDWFGYLDLRHDILGFDSYDYILHDLRYHSCRILLFVWSRIRTAKDDHLTILVRIPWSQDFCNPKRHRLYRLERVKHSQCRINSSLY